MRISDWSSDVCSSDLERNLPVPSNLNMVTMKPLRGTALFTFDPNLVFLIIDILFGGHGRYNTRVEGRDFTTTDQDRKSVVSGKSVSVGVDPGGRRIIQKILKQLLEYHRKVHIEK